MIDLGPEGGDEGGRTSRWLGGGETRPEATATGGEGAGRRLCSPAARAGRDVARIVARGTPEQVARVRCGSGRAERLVAFSCMGRGRCHSCAVKRAAVLIAFLREEVLADVGPAHWVLSIPKILRPHFLYHRQLLDRLCQTAYQRAREIGNSLSSPSG